MNRRRLRLHGNVSVDDGHRPGSLAGMAKCGTAVAGNAAAAFDQGRPDATE
jgi:hypothetical protein